MHEASVPLTSRRFGQTSRRDRWWVQPALVAAGLSAFIVYATWAAFQGTHYHWGPYLSPFHSPEIFGESAHSWLGQSPTGGHRGCRGRPPFSSCGPRGAFG